jgi:hypothetical protein
MAMAMIVRVAPAGAKTARPDRTVGGSIAPPNGMIGGSIDETHGNPARSGTPNPDRARLRIVT